MPPPRILLAAPHAVALALGAGITLAVAIYPWGAEATWCLGAIVLRVRPAARC
jgi:hypothetical protein